MLKWKDKNKTADISNDTTCRDKSKDIGEKGETWKIARQG